MNLQKSIIKIFKQAILISLVLSTFIRSYPGIATYSSNERHITDTLNLFSSAVQKLDFSGLDLSKYDVNIDETIGDKRRTGTLDNFSLNSALFKVEEFFGKMIGNTTVFLNNNEKEDIFQIDLKLDFNITETGKDVENINGVGLLKFDVKNFNFTLGYDREFFEYIVKPDLEIEFVYLNISILNATSTGESVQAVSDLVERKVDIKTLEVLISENIDKQIEGFFKNTEKPSYSTVSLKNKAEKIALATTPLLRPENYLNEGIINFLDGKPYNVDGSKIERIEYNQPKTSVFHNIFNIIRNSNRQVFLSDVVFADLMKVDFKKDSEITIYENDVKENIPFKFNVLYLSKYMPGLNYKYANNQKIYVEIKIRDVVYHYGETDLESEPKNRSYVMVKSDIFFKTAERNAGQTILDFSTNTKAYFEVDESKNSASFNIKLSKDFVIEELVAKNYDSLEFYNDLFKTEFAKSFTITNLGTFDYRLFEHPLLLNEIIGINHEIKPWLKGVLLYEPENKFNEKKSLKFLE